MKNEVTPEKHASVSLVVRTLLLSLLMLAIPLAAHAQQYSGTITGTVTDPSGAAVAAASVTATNNGTGSAYKATTSDGGVYVFAQLPVGTYQLSVKKDSFKEFVAKNVEVHTS